MKQLLVISRGIDMLNTWIGKGATWLILATVVISAGNAMMRKFFGEGSNALLEIQWYFFAAVFTLGSGYAFLKNAQVCIGFLANKFSPRTRNWIDVGGILILLLPFSYMMFTLTWPLLTQAYESGEMSFNPGGLIRWPVYAMLPAGFSLLALQGLSELIKRLDFIFGDGPDVMAHDFAHDAVE